MNPLRGSRYISGDAVVWKPQVLNLCQFREALFDALVERISREQAGNWIGQVTDKIERFCHEIKPVRSLFGDDSEISM